MDTDTNILEVVGTGDESVETTEAEINLGVVARGETALEASEVAANKASEVITAVTNFVAEAGEEPDIDTAAVQLFPISNEMGDIVSYEARNTLEVEVPQELAGEVIDTAITNGANEVQSITFEASDEALDAALEAAITEAIADAQLQADTVIDVLGLQQQAIVGIEVNTSDIEPIVPFFDLAARSSTPILGGEQIVTASVNLEIAYLDNGTSSPSSPLPTPFILANNDNPSAGGGNPFSNGFNPFGDSDGSNSQWNFSDIA
jgi:uncharacterized protein YggE